MSEPAVLAQNSNTRAALLLACLLLLGCNSSSQPSSNPTPQVGASPSEKSAASTALTAPVALTSVDRPAFDAAIAKQKGKVVLVDFWATWCGPCTEQLPHTIELGERFGPKGLAVITVSLDEPSEPAPVTNFLTAKKAGVATNLISQFGGSSQSMDAFEIPNGVPYYKLYDRTGKLRESFGTDAAAAKQFTSADIEAAVEKLLAE
jgi:thiol-disulfide isomerase/thioredoxin